MLCKPALSMPQWRLLYCHLFSKIPSKWTMISYGAKQQSEKERLLFFNRDLCQFCNVMSFFHQGQLV